MDKKAPTKKTSARIVCGDKIAMYVATATRENVVVYKEDEIIGGIYTTVKTVKNIGIRSEESQVFGDWEDFKWLVDGDMEEPEGTEIEFDKRARGNTNRLKGKDYRKMDDVNTVSNLSFGHGESVEDFLYTPVSIEELEEENNLEWAKYKDYRILVEDNEIEEFLFQLNKTDDIVGFDTETTGLLVNRTKRDKLVGMSFSLEDHTGVYIPFKQKRFENIKMGEDKFIELIRPFIHRGSKKAKKLVTHNGGFDWKVLKMYGIELNIVYDTFIRQSLKAIGKSKSIRKLKDIVSVIFGYDTVELEDMYVKRTKTEIQEVANAVKHGMLNVNDITEFKLETAEKQEDLMDFRFANRDFVELYGPADGDFPRLLHKEMDKDWDHKMDFIYRVEMEQIPVLGEQEYYGVRADKAGFEKLYEESLERKEILERKIFEEAGEEFNINSTPQKVKILFDKLGCPKKERYKTKKGNWGTGKEVLKDLVKYKDKNGNQKFPIAEYLQQYSKVQKLIDSFYGKLPSMIVDGYIFTSYHQMGTETGRISNSKPNLQQTEPTSRKYMLPDTDEFYFLICDYSQVEYRVMAGMGNETEVVKFFENNAEADYHIMAYANMMNKAYEDVTGEERSVGKTLNFGVTYGLEDASLAMNLHGDDSRFSQKKASKAREDYFKGVPNIRDFFEKKKDEAQEKGYAKTMFNRKREIVEFQRNRKLSNYEIGSGRRKGGNQPVQGTAADILKMAMARVRAFFRREGYYEDMVRLVMNIHDEIVIQVHKSINPYYATNIVRKAMEMDFSKYGFPPLYIGAIVGYNWFDGQNDDELEAPVYLLNEKRKEVEEAIERGEELPSYEDPRQVWQENIEKYALRAIEDEISKGYKDKETGEMKEIIMSSDMYKNGRLANYADYFGDVKNAVVEEIRDHGHEGIYESLDKISKFKTDLAKTSMEKIKKELDKEELTELDDIVGNESIVDNAFYFGEHKWSVVTWLKNEDVEGVFDSITQRLDSDDYEKVVYDKPIKKEGKDITKEFETVDEYIKKKKIRYNKENDRIRLYVDYDDIELFKHVDSMLVSLFGLDMFKEGLKKSNFGLVYEDGSEYIVQGYKFFHKFIPILKDIVKRHIMGTGYIGINEKIDEVGNTLLKEEVLDGTLEEKELKEDEKKYKESKNEKVLRKMKNYQQKQVR